jgi:hypothetical protein
MFRDAQTARGWSLPTTLAQHTMIANTHHVGRCQHARLWLGWACLTKKVPHATTTPIATTFKICVSHRKNGLLNRLPIKVGFSIFD